MMQKSEYLNLKLVLGSISLAIGMLAATFALFGWVEQDKPQYLLGNYGRDVCAFGGFGAMIFGAMLINDFLILRKLVINKSYHGSHNRTKK
jgi:hypothetical protein